jgi:hypothetical protein
LYGPDAFSGSLSYAGANAGTYAFTLGTLSAGGNYSLTLGGNVTFEITKADSPAAPGGVTGSYTGDGTTFTYTVTAISGAEYSKDGTTWQDSNEFTGFTTASPATTFYARIKETANVNTGAAGNTGAVTFALLSDRNAPVLNFIVTGDFPKTVTITPVSGAEYSFDGGTTYTSTNTYVSNAGESLNLAIRFAATATHNASSVATETIDTSNQNQNPAATPNDGGGSTGGGNTGGTTANTGGTTANTGGTTGNTGGTTGNAEGATGNTGGSGGNGTNTEIDEPAEPEGNAPIIGPGGKEIDATYIYTPEVLADGKVADIPADQSFFVAAPEGSLSWDTSQLDGSYDGAAGGYIFTPRTDAGSTVEITYTDADGNETILSFTITDVASPLGDGAKEDSGFPWWIIVVVIVVIAALLLWNISRKRRKDNNEKAA